MSKPDTETMQVLTGIMQHCPIISVARGMVRMAEDTADEGYEGIAKNVWLAVIEVLELEERYMYLAKLVGDGNKMIGIAPDEQKRDEYIRKAMEAA